MSLIQRIVRKLAGVCVAGACIVGVAAQPAALARQVMGSDGEESGDMMDAWSDSITRGDVKGFTRALKSTDEQQKSINDLFTAYRSQYETATKKLRDYQKALQEKSGGGFDAKVWKDAAPTFEQYNKHVRTLKSQFLEDMKSMLGPEQAEQWPRVERMVRRKEAIRTSMPGPSKVDLVNVVTGAMGNDPVPEEAAATLDRYEEEIDRANTELSEFRKELEGRQSKLLEEMADKGMEEMQKTQLKLMKELREKSKGSSEINARTFKKLIPLLPEAKRARFQSAYYKAAYDMMSSFMPGAASLDKAVAKAMELADVTAEQKTAIETALDDHGKEMVSVYEKYAETMERKAEDAANSDDPQAIQSIYFDQAAMMDLNTKRGEADSRAVQRIRAALTEEQLAKLTAPLKKSDLAKPNFDE